MVPSSAGTYHNRYCQQGLGTGGWGLGIRALRSRFRKTRNHLLASTFSRDLKRYGPQVQVTKPPSLGRSRRYCRRLARRHYENFTVASRLLPRRLRQHFYNVYAYCRWADDLADEPGDPQRSPGLAGLVGKRPARLLPRPDPPPGLRRPGRHDPQVRHSHRPLRRPAGRLSPGPAGPPLRRHRPTAELLPLFGQPGRPAGPLLGTLPHARAGAVGRLDLHGLATGQFLAGRGGRLRPGAHLPAVGRLPPLRLRREDVAPGSATSRSAA